MLLCDLVVGCMSVVLKSITRFDLRFCSFVEYRDLTILKIVSYIV